MSSKGAQPREGSRTALSLSAGPHTQEEQNAGNLLLGALCPRDSRRTCSHPPPSQRCFGPVIALLSLGLIEVHGKHPLMVTVLVVSPHTEG